MFAHSLRINGYDAEIEQREHAPQFLRVGLFVAVCTGLGLFSFFRTFENVDLISSYGLWFLMRYNGVATEAALSIVLILSAIFYSLSSVIFPESSQARFQLTWRLLVTASAFIALYLYTTTIYIESYEYLLKKSELKASGWFRSYLTDDTFYVFIPIALNNALMGVVAWVRDGDFFATLHRQHLVIGLVPASLTLVTMLPYDVMDLASLHVYVIAAAVGYLVAFALSLHFEYGRED